MPTYIFQINRFLHNLPIVEMIDLYKEGDTLSPLQYLVNYKNTSKNEPPYIERTGERYYKQALQNARALEI